MRASLDRNAQALASLLKRAAPKRAEKVPGLDWTVSELGKHLITEPRRFDRFGRGVVDDIGPDVAAFNRAELEAITEDDPTRQAEVFLAEHASYMAQATKHAPTDPYQWFGNEMEWSEGAGIYLGELCVHSLDLARTVGEDSSLSRQDALWIINGLVPILPQFPDPKTSAGFSGTFELKLRKGPSVLITFTNGKLTAGPKAKGTGQKIDCVISADPSAFLLVGYGRVSQWGPIMRGQLLAAGRKPWLALRFAKLLQNP
jgi:uncharacterized protein (TIGR03083 family)